MIRLFHSLRSQSLYSIFGRLTELMSEDYQEFEDDFIYQLPEMVSSLRKEIFFFEPKSKNENKSEETLILANRKKDQEIKELREKLSNLEQSKDEEISELSEKLASSNFQLEQVKTRLNNIPEEQKLPKWTSFEFVTEKNGAKGPTKSDCIGYYSEK